MILIVLRTRWRQPLPIWLWTLPSTICSTSLLRTPRQWRPGRPSITTSLMTRWTVSGVMWMIVLVSWWACLRLGRLWIGTVLWSYGRGSMRQWMECAIVYLSVGNTHNVRLVGWIRWWLKQVVPVGKGTNLMREVLATVQQFRRKENAKSGSIGMKENVQNVRQTVGFVTTMEHVSNALRVILSSFSKVGWSAYLSPDPKYKIYLLLYVREQQEGHGRGVHLLPTP